MSKPRISRKERKALDKLAAEISGTLNVDWMSRQLARGADVQAERSAKVRKRLKESGLY